MTNHSDVQIQSITAQEMRDFAVAAEVNVPIEQTWVWAEFEETFPDRQLLGFFAVLDGGAPVALLGLTTYAYHGVEFAWAKHGPVWLVQNSPDLERKAVTAIVKWLRDHSRRIAFVRLHLDFPTVDARAPLQIITYDTTVVVNLGATEAELMAGYKPRVRTMLRSAAKKTPIAVTDETRLAEADMGPYYAIMEETADRQGFTPWGPDVYQNLLEQLTDEHARLYAARVEGELAAFAIFTMCGSEVVYYYAAANELGREVRAPAQLLHQAALQFGQEGYRSMDLMGIGSKRCPELDPLTPFKSGFSKEVTEVSPAYDVAVSKLLLKALTALAAGKAQFDTLSGRFGHSEKGD